MKKMMRIAAASLCLALAITTLSACSSTENNKPAEEPSKPGEVVTTTEPTVEPAIPEPTEEPTHEPTTVAPEQKTITGFFQTQWADDVRNNADVLFTYDEYIYHCSVMPTDVT